ncbi:MAG: hypothetical protein JJE30_14175 [Desulfuromonadales bacterium]|nr:hypothetical protein [Desulfuromonadales bacterium]
MKKVMIIFALIFAVSGNALAGSEYDKCVAQEKALRTQEAGECKGFRYIFNPSGCFATQKILKEYTAGKCKKIGTAENVDFGAKPVIPEKKVINEVGAKQMIVEHEVPRQESTIEQLKEENTRLKAENIRLKAENEQLRKTGQ